MSSLLKLVAQRVALGLLLLLAVSVLIFVGTQILPGDVAQSILGQSATPQALANLREQLGLNDPAYVRYFRWLLGMLHGDMGTALSNGQDIAASLGGRLKNTLFLACWAAVVSVPLAIILGLIAVRHKNGFVDKFISGFTLASISLPEFFIGYLLIYFVAVQMQWLPSVSTRPSDRRGRHQPLDGVFHTRAWLVPGWCLRVSGPTGSLCRARPAEFHFTSATCRPAIIARPPSCAWQFDSMAELPVISMVSPTRRRHALAEAVELPAKKMWALGA